VSYTTACFGLLGYQLSPISDIENRMRRIPDNSRYWLAFDVDYDLDECMTFEVSYAHLIIPSAGNQVVKSTGAILEGDWHLSIEVA
jgi:long-subunit fatty acid transport protein